MAKKKSLSKYSFLVALVALVFGVVGFCMVFFKGFVYTTSAVGTIASGTAEYPGLAVIFGGTHDVVVSATTIIGAGSTTSSMEFAFNPIGTLAFVFALVAGVVGLFGSKVKFLNYVAVLLSLVGTVMAFFVVNGFAAVNSTENVTIDPSTFKWGATYIVALVCFVLETLGILFTSVTTLKK